MKLNVYSVYDIQAMAYLQPFFMQTKGLAIRGFTELVNDKEHRFGKHPDEYGLFDLGEYDDSTGQLVSHDQPIPLGYGHEFMN